jgi:hypothetical protein
MLAERLSGKADEQLAPSAAAFEERGKPAQQLARQPPPYLR